MTNYEKAEELQAAENYSMRSCWECNPAHDHLKAVGGLFTCFECSRWYMNGGYFDDDEHCEKPYQEAPELRTTIARLLPPDCG